MQAHDFDTLKEALNHLAEQGYTARFEAREGSLYEVDASKEYDPTEVVVTKNYRFDGMTNPSDEEQVLAIETPSGTKGTLVTAYTTELNHDEETIKTLSVLIKNSYNNTTQTS